MRQIHTIDVLANRQDSEIDDLTCARLRCLLAQARAKPEFQANPKLKKNRIYTIKRTDENGQLIEEGIMLMQSLILRTSKQGDERLQIGDPKVLGKGRFGQVKLATRYLPFLPKDNLDDNY